MPPVTDRRIAQYIAVAERTICKRPSFGFQKATFHGLKHGLLEHKRRHIGNTLTVNYLQIHFAVSVILRIFAKQNVVNDCRFTKNHRRNGKI